MRDFGIYALIIEAERPSDAQRDAWQASDMNSLQALEWKEGKSTLCRVAQENSSHTSEVCPKNHSQDTIKVASYFVFLMTQPAFPTAIVPFSTSPKSPLSHFNRDPTFHVMFRFQPGWCKRIKT